MTLQLRKPAVLQRINSFSIERKYFNYVGLLLIFGDNTKWEVVAWGSGKHSIKVPRCIRLPFQLQRKYLTSSPEFMHRNPLSAKQEWTARITASNLFLGLDNRRRFFSFTSAILHRHLQNTSQVPTRSKVAAAEKRGKTHPWIFCFFFFGPLFFFQKLFAFLRCLSHENISEF